eukprot:164607-Rhodomonas_salina.1
MIRVVTDKAKFRWAATQSRKLKKSSSPCNRDSLSFKFLWCKWPCFWRRHSEFITLAFENHDFCDDAAVSDGPGNNTIITINNVTLPGPCQRVEIPIASTRVPGYPPAGTRYPGYANKLPLHVYPGYPGTIVLGQLDKECFGNTGPARSLSRNPSTRVLESSSQAP